MNLPFERERIGADGLGVARILYFSIVLISTAPFYLAYWGQFEGPKCTEISGIIIDVSMGYQQAVIVAWIFQISTLFAAIGLFTQSALWVSFLSLFLLNSNALQFCYWNHHSIPLHIGMLLWALLDRSSSFRLDSLLRKRFKFLRENSAVSLTPHSDGFLPLLSRLYFAIIFFLSGYTKLKYSGLNWITSDNLRNILITQNFAHENFWWSRHFVSINAFVVNLPFAGEFMAFATIVLELCAPLALFKTRFRNWIVADLALMQVGVFILMYINFSPWAATYVFWLPLDRWGARLRKWLRSLESRKIQGLSMFSIRS